MTEAVPAPLATVFVGLFGLLVGSFLNVCIHRLPLGESVVRPRSRCPGCRAEIPWFRNIPVASWVALGGKCAACGARIPIRYPFVELLSGGLAVALWVAYGPDARFPIALGFGYALLVLFFTDWDHQLLPDAVTLSGFVLGVGVAWFNPFLGEPGWGRVYQSIAGAAIGSGVLWGIGALYGRLRGVEAMGLGDVKMMAFVGAVTGPAGTVFTIFVGSVLGAVVGISRIPVRGGSLQDTLPFGCFLAPAAFAALLFGRAALGAYLDLVFRGT